MKGFGFVVWFVLSQCWQWWRRCQGCFALNLWRRDDATENNEWMSEANEAKRVFDTQAKTGGWFSCARIEFFLLSNSCRTLLKEPEHRCHHPPPLQARGSCICTCGQYRERTLPLLGTDAIRREDLIVRRSWALLIAFCVWGHLFLDEKEKKNTSQWNVSEQFHWRHHFLKRENEVQGEKVKNPCYASMLWRIKGNEWSNESLIDVSSPQVDHKKAQPLAAGDSELSESSDIIVADCHRTLAIQRHVKFAKMTQIFQSCWKTSSRFYETLCLFVLFQNLTKPVETSTFCAQQSSNEPRTMTGGKQKPENKEVWFMLDVWRKDS